MLCSVPSCGTDHLGRERELERARGLEESFDEKKDPCHNVPLPGGPPADGAGAGLGTERLRTSRLPHRIFKWSTSSNVTLTILL